MQNKVSFSKEFEFPVTTELSEKVVGKEKEQKDSTIHTEKRTEKQREKRREKRSGKRREKMCERQCSYNLLTCLHYIDKIFLNIIS